MSSISVSMSYLFCEIDGRKDMWQNHFANIVYRHSIYTVYAIKNKLNHSFLHVLT